MKTKIIYISGSEIFDIADIRCAFNEVRNALNLDKTTVLFGVPVDQEDAGFATTIKNKETSTPVEEDVYDSIQQSNDEPIITDSVEMATADTEEPSVDIIYEEETVEKIDDIIEKEVQIDEISTKKRGRPRKNIESEQQVTEDQTEEEKIVPILSVLSTKEDATETEPTEIASEQNADIEPAEEIEITDTVSEKSDENTDQNIENLATDIEETPNMEIEPDLEKLLSEMKPLQEDVSEEKTEDIESVAYNTEDEETIDATLEQLATEFAETQDKIATETKSSSRSKIGKLRNILPFKQSKHKDQGLGDLFGWAGVAANDEDFAVPGFFTNAASKK